MNQPATWKKVAERYPCTTCGSGPGQPCIRPSRRASNEVHVARSRLASANRWKDPEDVEPQDKDRR